MLFGVQRVVKPVAVLLLKILIDGFIERERRDNDLLGLEPRVEIFDGSDDFLDLRVAELECIRNRFFGNFQRAGFDHDDASSVPAMMIFIKLFFWSATVGLITNCPSTRPTRTQAIGFSNGRSEQYAAADALVTAMTSGSFSLSAESTMETT